MFIFRSLVGLWQTAIHATLWIGNQIKALGCAVAGLVHGALRSLWNLLQAGRRHPFVTTTVLLVLGLAWLVLGWTPLLSVVGLGVLLRLVARFGLRYLWWRAAGPTSSPAPAPALPQRNGRPANRPAGPVVAGVS